MIRSYKYDKYVYKIASTYLYKVFMFINVLNYNYVDILERELSI